MARAMSPKPDTRPVPLAPDPPHRPRPVPPVPGEDEASHATAQRLLRHAGRWSGNDLEERLAEVYATRSTVEW